MPFVSLAVKLAQFVRVTGGPVIVKGLKSPACPAKIRQSVVDFAQDHHRMYTKVHRRSSGCASDVVVDPLEYEYAIKAGAGHVAELSVMAAAGVATFYGIQCCKSYWRKKIDERIEKRIMEKSNANLISEIRALSALILKAVQLEEQLNEIYNKQSEFLPKRKKNNLQLTTV